MDDAVRFIEAFRARVACSPASKLDALMDLERLRDARIVSFLLEVLTDRREATEVRIHVLQRLRDNGFVPECRVRVAKAMLQVLTCRSSPDVRIHATLALAEFTDVDSVSRMLGSLALDPAEPIDVRYAAFTSLQRAGPTAECVAFLRQLLRDEELGRAAGSLLSSWRLERDNSS